MTLTKIVKILKVIFFVSFCVCCGSNVQQMPVNESKNVSGDTIQFAQAKLDFDQNCIFGLGPADSQASYETLGKLSSANMQNHVIDVYGYQESTKSYIVPPREFDEIVKIGKPIVPCLIGILENDEEVFRLASELVLREITNNHFGEKTFIGNSESRREMHQEYVGYWKIWWLNHKSKTRENWLVDDLSDTNQSSQKGDDNFGKISNAIKELSYTNKSVYIAKIRPFLLTRNFCFTAVEALAKLNDKEVIPYIIETHLRRSGAGDRERGANFLRELSGESLSFNPNGTRKERLESIRNMEINWSTKKSLN